MNLLARHPNAALCCTIGDWLEIETGWNWQVGVGMADNPCYISPSQMLALERRGRLHIATHTAVLRREPLLRAGKFLAELGWHCDWFAAYVTGFRHGICYVPEVLARCNIHTSSYYQRGRRDAVAHATVLRNLLARLNSESCQDVAPIIRQSGALYLFEWPVLRLMLSTPELRQWITPNFLVRNLWHTFRLRLKPLTPNWAANLYFRLAGFKAPSAQVPSSSQPGP